LLLPLVFFCPPDKNANKSESNRENESRDDDCRRQSCLSGSGVEGRTTHRFIKKKLHSGWSISVNIACKQYLWASTKQLFSRNAKQHIRKATRVRQYARFLVLGQEVSMLRRTLVLVSLSFYFLLNSGFDLQSGVSPIEVSLNYFTYLGGSENDKGISVAVCPSGNIYVGGVTWSPNFPTKKAFQSVCESRRYCRDAFLTKMDPSGRKLLFSTFLDQKNVEYVTGISIDKEGNAYICAQFTGFMTHVPSEGTAYSARPGYQGGGFVAKFDSSGNLIYKTPLNIRGFTAPEAIAVDESGNAYVAGWMPSRSYEPAGNTLVPGWPLLPGDTSSRIRMGVTPIERSEGFARSVPERDAFIFKLDDSGRIIKEALIESDGDDCVYAIALNSTGDVYLTGSTSSENFPSINPLQIPGVTSTRKRIVGDTNLFVAKLDMTNKKLIYSTVFGGSSRDAGYALALDARGGVYIAGGTASTDFPTLNPAQETMAGVADSFLAKFDENGHELLFSTYLGAGSLDIAVSMALDREGAAYLAGTTQSPDFPVLNAWGLKDGCKKAANCVDAFVAKVDASGRKIIAGRFGGEKFEKATGIAIDASGAVYVVGSTRSAGLRSRTALRRSLRGVQDAFIVKFEGLGPGNPPSSDTSE
jgi:hypothetical protein